MNKILNYLVVAIVSTTFFSCCSNENKTASSHDGHHANAVKPTTSTGNYGDLITQENALAIAELPAMLIENDSVEAKFTGNIHSVCQMTGCWITLDLGSGETVHVTFKDDAFLLPKDAAGKTAVIQGKGQREELSVDYLKHLAHDDGKSQEEIDAITEPRMEYTFIASGVIIK